MRLTEPKSAPSDMSVKDRRPANGNTLAEVVVEQISQRISDGQYRPGDRLVEADLARDLSVGRQTIREALRRLESNLYIRFEPNRGAMVARPTAEEVTGMLRVRSVIAGLGARAAAERIDLPGHRERVSILFSNLEEERALGLPGRHRSHNGRFHRAINEMSGINYVGALMDQVNIPLLYDVYFREMTQEQWETNLSDHYDLARAIMNGDGDAAEHFARRHSCRSIEIANAIADRL